MKKEIIYVGAGFIILLTGGVLAYDFLEILKGITEIPGLILRAIKKGIKKGVLEK